MIQQTSIESFVKLRDTGDLGDRQLQMLRLIEEHGPVTNRELAMWARVPINSVTPRVLELRNMGFVRCAGKVYDAFTLRMVNMWERA